MSSRRLLPILALFAITAFCSSASAYNIEAKGAEAKGSENKFAFSETTTANCSKVIYKQPNTTGKELVTEEQSLIATFSECIGKVAGLEAKVTIPAEVRFTISAGEKNGGSESKWKGILMTAEKALTAKIVRGEATCTVEIPASSSKHFKELQWENLKTTPGSFESSFSVNASAEGTSSGGGCEAMAIKKVIPVITWSEPKIIQNGEHR
jgi:hypothetical protein